MSETYELGAIFDEHVADEFVAKDVTASMATMTAEPFVNHVPTMRVASAAKRSPTSTTNTSSGIGPTTPRSFR